MKPFVQQMIRHVLALLILAGLVLYPALTQPAYAVPGGLYDPAEVPADFCSGKRGNYPHPNPTVRTKYVACTDQNRAYEMRCSSDTDGTQLYYVQDSGPDPSKSYCDYPEAAGFTELSEKAASSNVNP